MIKDKYFQKYNELTTQLYIYAEAVRVLAKGYLPISFVTPFKLKEISDAGKTTVRKKQIQIMI